MNEADLPAVERNRLIQTLQSLPKSEDNSFHTLTLIEISNLKQINHNYGQDIGNAVILEVWQKLCSLSRAPMRVFRTEGNRFAFIGSKLANFGFAVMVANRLKATLKVAVHSNQGEVEPNLHVGIALFRKLSSLTDCYSLLNVAEDSLDLDKKGVSYHEHEARLANRQVNMGALQQKFLEALQHNEFELYYQPKQHISDSRITSVEALLRWRPDGKTYVSPLEVVSLAEQNNRLFQLTKWVLFTAVRQIAQWEDAGMENIKVAVNVPADLIHNADIVSMVNDALKIWDVDGSRLIIEITESAIMVDKNSGSSNLDAIRELGVFVSIDDFGTGFSSLSYFRDIPANELKIDRSFIYNILSDDENRALVKIIIEIAKLFDLNTVAEGIEDQPTLELLKQLGCDTAQGYHIARPMPAEEFFHWHNIHLATTQ